MTYILIFFGIIVLIALVSYLMGLSNRQKVGDQILKDLMSGKTKPHIPEYKSGPSKQDEKRKNNMIIVKKKDEIAENKKIKSKFDFQEEESPKDNSKTNKYEKDSDSTGKIDVLGKTLYKKDISGLKEYFKKNPTMGRVYDDFTWSIRNGLTAREFLEKSNFLVNDEIRNATALGFTDIVSFLVDMLKINKNAELRKDLYAFVEASKILLKIEKEDIENNKEEHQKKDEKVENKKIENDNSYSNKEEKYIDKMYKVKTDNGRFLNDNGDKIIVEFVSLVLEGKIEENYWELIEEIAEYFIITDFYINDKELETKVNKIHKKNRYRIYGEGDVYFEGMEYEFENEESYYELTAESTEEAIMEFEKNLNITN